MRRQSMSAIRCVAAVAVGSGGDASACSVNGGEGGAAEAAAEAAVASRDVRARWARYARSSSAVFRSRLRSCACEGGGVGGVHLGSRGRARHLCLPGWWPPGRRSDRSRRSPVYRRRSPRPLEVAAAAAVQYFVEMRSAAARGTVAATRQRLAVIHTCTAISKHLSRL